jgi:hypothetical protein
LWSSKILAKKACDLSSDSLAKTIALHLPRFDVLLVTRSASSTALCFPSFVQQNSWASFPLFLFFFTPNLANLAYAV